MTDDEEWQIKQRAWFWELRIRVGDLVRTLASPPAGLSGQSLRPDVDKARGVVLRSLRPVEAFSTLGVFSPEEVEVRIRQILRKAARPPPRDLSN